MLNSLSWHTDALCTSLYALYSAYTVHFPLGVDDQAWIRHPGGNTLIRLACPRAPSLCSTTPYLSLPSQYQNGDSSRLTSDV